MKEKAARLSRSLSRANASATKAAGRKSIMQVQEWTYGNPPSIRLSLRADTTTVATEAGGIRLEHQFFILGQPLPDEKNACGGAYIRLPNSALVEEALAEGTDPLLFCFLSDPRVSDEVRHCPDLFALVEGAILISESKSARPDPAPDDGSIRI